MASCNDLIAALERSCPPPLAEDWDNVGFLLGERQKEVRRVMTCLTLSFETVDEAIAEKADLVISHHPFPFRAEKRWTTETPTGSILLRLVRGDVAVFSPHTAHDSAFWGVNRQLAELFGLVDVKPLNSGTLEASPSMLEGASSQTKGLLSSELGAVLGSGRIGSFSEPIRLSTFIRQVSQKLRQPTLTYVGDPNREVCRLAIGCGAADDFIVAAAHAGADVLLLGEARFHGALLASELAMSLVLPGHYATERFAMETMAERLAALFPDLTVWASRAECDPIRCWPAPQD
ncbi:MAG: Nif3-like dinuclear metal center hexameric protein [Thermoguttaceae bacterium]|jgi:dinuclear metal center YbgI/SA1388 family protein